MLRSRKGALLLLVVAAFWSALPLFACLLAGHASDRSACCTEMERNCPMQSADMNSPCCRTHSGDAAVVPETSSAPEHGPITALVPHPDAGAILAATRDAIGCIPEAPPPDTSPGASSILRI
jgi:hypothetical protein